MSRTYFANAAAEATPILVASTSSGSPTTLIEPKSGDSGHRLTIRAWNTDSSARTLTVQWGGTATQNKIPYELPVGFGPVVVLEDFKMAEGVDVTAFASAANVVGILLEVA